MDQVYNFLGLTVDCVNNHDPYGAAKEPMPDITYGTNNEYGFDYLRDNMKLARMKWPSAVTSMPLLMRSTRS